MQPEEKKYNIFDIKKGCEIPEELKKFILPGFEGKVVYLKTPKIKTTDDFLLINLIPSIEYCEKDTKNYPRRNEILNGMEAFDRESLKFINIDYDENGIIDREKMEEQILTKMYDVAKISHIKISTPRSSLINYTHINDYNYTESEVKKPLKDIVLTLNKVNNKKQVQSIDIEACASNVIEPYLKQELDKSIHTKTYAGLLYQYFQYLHLEEGGIKKICESHGYGMDISKHIDKVQDVISDNEYLNRFNQICDSDKTIDAKKDSIREILRSLGIKESKIENTLKSKNFDIVKQDTKNLITNSIEKNQKNKTNTLFYSDQSLWLNRDDRNLLLSSAEDAKKHYIKVAFFNPAITTKNFPESSNTKQEKTTSLHEEQGAKVEESFQEVIKDRVEMKKDCFLRFGLE
jgi:hypothetical protein